MTERIHAVVSGRVQGVGFRWSTQLQAQQLGLTGWVVNRANGSVELQAEGADDAVMTFQRWLNDGPPGASVSSVVVEHIEPSGGTGFEIRR